MPTATQDQSVDVFGDLGPSRRAFVAVGQRWVHFRQSGSGPVVVMLHQSPQNSRMWLEPMRALSRRYRVLAPDLPGFGYSDPLDVAQPTIADLSAACHEWLDALGITECALFGMHTGGIVAVQMGLDRPDRVGLVLVDGYAIFSEQERAVIGEHYLPPFEPDWSGQHLRWLWARMREQSFFFPWCESGAQFALRYAAPDTARTQSAVMDILEVGDRYRLGYRAALQFVDRGCVAHLEMPTRLFYREDDVLLDHCQRLPELPPHVQSQRLSDRPALWAAVEQALAGWSAKPCDELPLALSTGWQRHVVATTLGEISTWVWRQRSEIKCLKLILHAPGQSPIQLAMEAANDTDVLIQPDLPGHGASVECAPGGLEQTAQALVELCLSLVSDVELQIEAHQGAVGLALGVVQRWTGSVSGLTLIQPWLLNVEERDWLLMHLPNLMPMPAGGHLLEAWQWERERHFFAPWRPPVATHRLGGAAPNVERVHANTVTLICLGDQFSFLMSEWIQPDLIEPLLNLPFAVTLHFDPSRDDGRLSALERQLTIVETQENRTHD